jgi:acyl-coenzyme A synthetase/AMP-(fatty) acid ligase
MRKMTVISAAAILALGAIAARVGSQPAPANAFDRLKTLVGEWDGTDPAGKQVADSIRLLSNNTVLEETSQTAKDNQMVMMYTPEGNRLALTHYCSKGNQPHLETPAVTASSNEFAFAFTSAANLASNDDMHMHGMRLKIEDNDHFSETWTLMANGKEQTETFHLTRKK